MFPDISYGFYEVFADLYHIDALRPKMGEGLTIDPRDYTGTGRCVVIANPNAQTGVALPLAAVEGIVKGSPESVVVVDEAYVDFGGETAAPLVEKYPNVLVVRTFSKSALARGRAAGLRPGRRGAHRGPEEAQILHKPLQREPHGPVPQARRPSVTGPAARPTAAA